MKILTLALTAAIALTATAVEAKPKKKKAPASKPFACVTYTADPQSRIIGHWSLKQRDDGQGWAGPWDVEFKADGTWVQEEKQKGYWCQNGDLIVFGYSSKPHTTYRGLIGVNTIQGVESWNDGGTGVFEMIR